MRRSLSFLIVLFLTRPALSQLTTFTGGYNAPNTLQLFMECNPFEKNYPGPFSCGIRAKIFNNTYQGLNVEYFERLYMRKPEKTFDEQRNSRWFLQVKAGYGVVKPNTPKSVELGNYVDKISYTWLAGFGLGYKFVLGEYIVLDLLYGYHYQPSPIFSGSADYKRYHSKKWDLNVAIPYELQWGIGFQID
jgi:hypothetical protein